MKTTSLARSLRASAVQSGSAALVLGMVLVAIPAVVQAQWDPEQSLATSAFPAAYVAASGSLVHAIVASDPVAYRRSTDEGATWSEPIVLGGRAHLNDPIAADGPLVWAVYLENVWTATDMPCCPRVLGDLVLRRSLDGGERWLPAQRLTSGAGAYRISMAVSGTRVHIAWMDYRTRGWDVRYLRSEDGGVTWEPERIVAAGGFSGRPQVAAQGDRVAIAYGLPPANAPLCFAGKSYQSPCSETYLLTSTDGGATFMSPVQVSPSLVNAPAAEADLSIRADVALLAPNAIVVAWDESQNSTGWPNGFRTEQYARVSVDGGASWHEPARITDSPNATHNALAASGSSVHLVWFDSRHGNDEIYYRASRDGGLTWESEERLTHSRVSASTPSVAVSANYVHVLWIEANNESRYRRRRR